MDAQMPILSPSPESLASEGYGERQPRLEDRSPLVAPAPVPVARTATRWERWLASRVYRRLRRLNRGTLQLDDHAGCHSFGCPAPDAPKSRVRVRNARFYRDLAWAGSMGAAEAYLRGDWDSDDLVGLFRLLAHNETAMMQLEGPARWWLAPIDWLRLRWTRNTQSGSRRNILAHYDLGNEFFRTFLDDTMTYSCGFFRSPNDSLRDASLEKYDRICRKLRLQPDHHLVEIGSGWGGFAMHAARCYGCRVTTTTISQQQGQYVRQAVRDAGLESRVTVLSHDYRRLGGQFDRLVSIEMVEAVGHEFLATYFGRCSRLLKPDGEMVLQAITIPDQRHEVYRRSVDFIRHYVFPGGCLPCLASMADAVKRATDLQLVHLEDMTTHYAETLRRWRRRYLENLPSIRSQGLNDRFIRTWDYYLAYCEAGFRERWIGVAQLHWLKPHARPRLLPSSGEG